MSFRNDNIHFVVLREGLEARLRRVDDNIGRIYCVANDEQALSATLLSQYMPVLLLESLQGSDQQGTLLPCCNTGRLCEYLLRRKACVQVDIPDDVRCIDTTTEDELPKTSMGYLITWFDRYVLKVGDVVRGPSSCRVPAGHLQDH